jgi:PAS domain S-box-containing protein
MGIPLRTLIIEDNEDDAILVIRVLQKGGFDPIYERVETAEAMRLAIDKGTWDIIISDYSMPHFSGAAALQLYKDTGLEIPFIIVSGTIGDEAAVAAMVAGAHDYLMKNSLARLVPAVQRELQEAAARRQRNRTAEALRESSRFNAMLLQTSPLGMHIVDEDGQLLFLSPAMEKLLGQNAPGCRCWDLYKDDKKPCAGCPLEQEIEAGVTGITETSGMLGGRAFEISHTGMIFGGKKAILEVFHDITERRRVEAALRESDEQFRATFEQAAVGIAQVAPDGSFLRFNQRLCDIVSYAREELLTKSFQDITHSDEVGNDVANLQRLLANEIQTYSKEKRYIRKDGSNVWVNLTVSLVREPTGAPKYFVSIIEDISERKQAQDQLMVTLESLRRAFAAIIQVMVSVVEARDPYTAGHQRRSADLARAMATEMGLPQEQIDGIRMAGSIHDVGKLCVPAELLSKPTKLSATEFALIKEHSLSGYEILKDVESPWPLAQIVYQHHERMNGTGYPRNLKGEEILMEARIMAVADVVEAMASHRPYRPALGLDAALEEIEKNSGTLYDSAVADACLCLFRTRGYRLDGS